MSVIWPTIFFKGNIYGRKNPVGHGVYHALPVNYRASLSKLKLELFYERSIKTLIL